MSDPTGMLFAADQAVCDRGHVMRVEYDGVEYRRVCDTLHRGRLAAYTPLFRADLTLEEIGALEDAGADPGAVALARTELGYRAEPCDHDEVSESAVGYFWEREPRYDSASGYYVERCLLCGAHVRGDVDLLDPDETGYPRTRIFWEAVPA